MNIRTRAALMLLASALPARELNVSKVLSLRAKLDKLCTELEAVPMNAGKVDVRDLLTLILTEAGA